MAKTGDGDQGVWAQERGRVITPLRGGLSLLFNSAAGHCCIPHLSLLPYVCNVDGLRRHGNAFANARITAALELVRADATLMHEFCDEKAAAQFISSLVGTTTYQQSDVTHQCMRAAAVGRPELVLRGFGQREAELERVAERASMTAQQRLAAKREAARVMHAQLSKLKVGMRLQVTFEDGACSKASVRRVEIVADVRDCHVVLEYDEPGFAGQLVPERLGCMQWKVVR